MISKEELDRTILELEAKDTTFANCERLCWLYTVRDHITGQQFKQPEPLSLDGENSLFKVIDGKDSSAVWAVIADLLDTIKITSPKLYNSVIEKNRKIINYIILEPLYSGFFAVRARPKHPPF